MRRTSTRARRFEHGLWIRKRLRGRRPLSRRAPRPQEPAPDRQAPAGREGAAQAREGARRQARAAAAPPRAQEGAALTAPEEAQKTDKPRMRKLRFAFVILGLGLLAFVSWIFGIMMAVAQDLPSLENRQQYLEAENSVVYDATTNKLATLTNNQGRILLDSEEIAPVMKEAVVAIEDRRFYEHNGVDYQGIARAVWQDVVTRSAQQGASTITQQFVKNALAAQDSRTVFQKLREAALAYHLERNWTKDKILTEYLNEIYFGEGATGIEAAAKTYFSYNHPGCGESEDAEPCASELLPWEAALLAGIISSPSAYSPRAFPENAKIRRDQVLAQHARRGLHHARGVRRVRRDPDPRRQGSDSAGRELGRAVLHLVAAPAAGRPLRRRRGLRRRAPDPLDPRPRAPEPGPGDHAVDPGGDRADRLRGRARQRDRRRPGDGRRLRLRGLAVQPGDQRPPPARIGVQAVHPGHRARAGPLDQRGVHLGAAGDPVPGQGPRRNGKGDEGPQRPLRRQQLRRPYLGSASIATATTYSDNSVYSQLGTQVGAENVAATAKKMGIETDLSTELRVLDQRRPLRALQPGADPRRARDRGHPLEMAHAYNTLAADGRRLSGTMAASSGGPVGILEVTDGDGYDAGRPRARPDRRQRRERDRRPSR